MDWIARNNIKYRMGEKETYHFYIKTADAITEALQLSSLQEAK